MAVNRSLIIDVGMSEGNDTAFYLAKGFDVVGVEADATLHAGLRERFAPELAAGRLRLLQRAAAASGGGMVRFWHNNHDQGHSAMATSARSPAPGQVTEFEVPSIDWPELRAVAGVPYYMKLDIEGAEPAFLSSMAGAVELPLFISTELPNFWPIQSLFDLGYRHFRLINQMLWNHLTLPDPPLEGRYVPKPDGHHWSGPFGRELPGTRWFSFDEIRALHDQLHALWLLGTILTGWLDCHACLPEALVEP